MINKNHNFGEGFINFCQICYTKKIQQIMENCVTINVPIKVDLEIGTNWGNVK